MDAERFTVARPARLRNLDSLSPAKVVSRDGVFVGRDLFGCANRNHFAAVFARTGSDIHHIVRRSYGFFIVFHHNQGVSEVAHTLEGF